MILKWIGIILGGILGVFLVFSVLVLCVPVRYKICGRMKQETKYMFSVRFLGGIVSIKKRLKSSYIILSVCGIPIKRLAKIGENGQKNEKRKKSKTSSGKKKIKRTAKRKKGFSFDKLFSIIGLVKDKHNQNAVGRLWQEGKQLLRYLSPDKVQGRLLIGTGDPCTTGMFFGGISLISIAYEKGVHIVPDFENVRFEAEGYIKGKVRVIYFVRLAFRLYKEREVKRLWKQIHKVKKEAA